MQQLDSLKYNNEIFHEAKVQGQKILLASAQTTDGDEVLIRLDYDDAQGAYLLQSQYDIPKDYETVDLRLLENGDDWTLDDNSTELPNINFSLDNFSVLPAGAKTIISMNLL